MAMLWSERGRSARLLQHKQQQAQVQLAYPRPATAPLVGLRLLQACSCVAVIASLNFSACLRVSCLLHSVGHAGLIHDSSASVAYSDPAKPLKISDVPCPRPNTHLEELTAIVTMLIFFG